MMKKIALFVFLIALTGCSVKYTPKMVQHIKGSVFKATDRGYYTAELVMKPDPPLVGKNSAHLIIHDYEADDITGLNITVIPFMPEKGIQSNEKPVVKDAGRGLYIIENIYFRIPGMWELRLKISGPYMVDTVVLPLPEIIEKP
ncbi:MAG: FixH family protein [Nitrospirota bacterium]